MKKQNLLMYAYVVFLFVCLFVKSFWTFPLWDAFVIAITCASYFFAFGDYFYQLANGRFRLAEMYKQRVDIISAGQPLTKRIIEQNKHTLALACSEGNKYKAAAEALTSAADVLDNAYDFFEEQSIDIQKSVSQYSKEGNRYLVCASFANAFGFLSFLCILAFFNDSLWLVSLQDTLSAWAFAIIMLTQCLKLIDDHFIEKSEKISEEFQQLIDKIKIVVNLGKLAGLEDNHNAD